MEKEMKILDLPLKKEWYNMIESGTKKEEYREIKPYWCNRLLFGHSLGIKLYEGHMFDSVTETNIENPLCHSYKYLIPKYGTRGYTHVRFRYGYTKQTMLFELKGITIGKGKTEWGAPEDKEVFILKLGDKIA